MRHCALGVSLVHVSVCLGPNAHVSATVASSYYYQRRTLIPTYLGSHLEIPKGPIEATQQDLLKRKVPPDVLTMNWARRAGTWGVGDITHTQDTELLTRPALVGPHANLYVVWVWV